MEFLLPAYVVRREVMFFTNVCLLTREVRTPVPGSSPGPFLGVLQHLVPCLSGGYSSPGWGEGTPVLAEGGMPVLAGSYPVLAGRYPRTGALPRPGEDWGIPPPHGTGYTTGSMPLAVSHRRTF